MLGWEYPPHISGGLGTACEGLTTALARRGIEIDFVEFAVGTIATNPDQSKLTSEYGRRAVAFIEAHRDEPFFVYLAHSMPHVPLFASDAFEGRTKRGLFGDVIEEIDDTVGRILETLERLGLERLGLGRLGLGRRRRAVGGRPNSRRNSSVRSAATTDRSWPPRPRRV